MPINFEDIPFILTQRDKDKVSTDPKNLILYLDESNKKEENLLCDFILKKIARLNFCEVTFPLKIGIVYRYGQHTTPIVIEVIDESINVEHTASSDGDSEYDEKELSSLEDIASGIETHYFPQIAINIYNTDSRSFEVQDGAECRASLIDIVQQGFKQGINIRLYAFGLIDELEDRLNTIRQHTDGDCAVFSLIDIETLLSISDPLSDFFSEHVECQQKDFLPAYPLERDPFGHTRLYHMRQLPPDLAMTMQSVHGAAYDKERRGIEQWLANRSDEYIELVLSSPESPGLSSEKVFFDNPTKRLIHFLKECSEDGVVGKVSVGKLYHFIQNWQMSRNFVVDALTWMYERVLQKSDRTDEESTQQYNALTLSVDNLCALLVGQKVGISPLQSFAQECSPYALQCSLPTSPRDAHHAFFPRVLSAEDASPKQCTRFYALGMNAK